VIDTLTVSDPQLPKGPPHQSDAGQTEDVAVPIRHVVAAGLLILLAIGCLLWLFLDRPTSLAGTASLVVVTAILLGASTYFVLKFLPVKIYGPLAALAGVAVTSGTLIATLLTIPGQPSTNPSSSTSSSTTQAQSSSTSPSPDESDPFTWDLNFKAASFCEGFVVRNALLKSLPRGDKLDAEWAYKNGGATANPVGALIIQGKSDDAVVIQNLSIIDVHMEEVPADASEIYPCNPGGDHIASRYYEVVLDEQPRLIQRPGIDVDDNTTEPIKEFPYRISRSEVEYFTLILGQQGPRCICSFRLALDWISGGRSGRTIIGRKFGDSIRTFVPGGDDRGLTEYERTTGTEKWYPPLPE
jgi:hypothetical protein